MPYCDAQAKAITPEQIDPPKKMASYHKTNLGDFGRALITDRHGYTHTTIRDWLAADMGSDLDDMSYDEKRDWAREQAAAARKALAAGEKAAMEWQRDNA